MDTNAPVQSGVQSVMPPKPFTPPKWLVRVVVVVFSIYVGMLYLLVLNQEFGWGLFPSKLDVRLEKEIKTLADPSTDDKTRADLTEEVINWGSFAVPHLIDAIEKNQPGVRAPASKCLIEIGKRFYDKDLTDSINDPTALRHWWQHMQEKWDEAAKNATQK